MSPANQPPIADAGDDQTVEQDSHAGASVILDGSGSSDPDGDPLTYTWREGGIIIGGPTTEPTAQVTLQLGEHTIELTVDDGTESDTDEVVVTVVDTTPPEIFDISADPDILWPPNNKMVSVFIFIETGDICTEIGDLDLYVTAESSDPDDTKGNGRFTGDVDSSDGFTNPVDVSDAFFMEDGGFVGLINLRAERSGGSADRIYTIEATVTDISGNWTINSCTVSVPHDQGNGNEKGKKN